MATPLLRGARLSLPQTRIVGACRPGLDALLAGTPWLDDVIVEESKSLPGSLRMAGRIRRLRPDAALLLPNSARSALIALLGGARRRIGYRRHGRGPLLTDPVEYDRGSVPVSTVHDYIGLGAAAFGSRHLQPRLELSVTDEQRAEGARLLDGVARPFVVLCPGANKPGKRWPAARYSSVARELSAQGMSAVAAAAPSEHPEVRAVVEASDAEIVDLVQRGITLGGLKAVIADADLVVTNDTGPRHIAAALGRPAVVIFGPTDPRWTIIDSPIEKTLTADPFLPETLVADDHPRRCAVTKITVGDVVAASRELLGKRA